MDKLYGDYDKVVEKYKKGNIQKRKTEKGEKNEAHENFNIKEVKEKSGNEKKKENESNKKETNKKKKKQDNTNPNEVLQNNYVDGVSNNNENKNVTDKNVNKQVDQNMEKLIDQNVDKDNVTERSYNEYKIRKKVSIEINKKFYNDIDNLHSNDKAFKDKIGINDNNYNLKKKRAKIEDYKIKQLLSKKDKIKFFINFLFVLYYIFYIFHFILEIQLKQVYYIVINTFTIVMISALLLYTFLLKVKNKKLKKIILYVTNYIILLYCIHIFNTFKYWVNIYFNFTISKKFYYKYKSLFKDISFVFAYFTFDEIFLFLSIFYTLFFITSSTLTFTMFYYLYNFISYVT
ncbi:conserved membrane protein, unknown function [Hepatocystis sp. ex Piliocolobus tephrosceles]|nr:conserved membrane protein, unknown function [Hepatocystis sp. ex Piliocolobus tephrosceles]